MGIDLLFIEPQLSLWPSKSLWRRCGASFAFMRYNFLAGEGFDSSQRHRRRLSLIRQRLLSARRWYGCSDLSNAMWAHSSGAAFNFYRERVISWQKALQQQQQQ
jgi:hypothetical protein